MRSALQAICVALALAALGASSAWAVRPDEMLADPALEARARALSKELRCLVCQNESIDDSSADLAHDLRVLVRDRIKKGDTDEQAVDYLVARYGEFVLLKPRFDLRNAALWGTPVVLLLAGGLFMMAGAYTLAKNGHVRGDILYGFLPPRVQAGLDLILYIVFFFPGVIALVWAGWYYAGYSIAIREHSSLMANGPPIYPFKAFIPIAGAVLLVQGEAEVLRCVLCLRRGAWHDDGGQRGHHDDHDDRRDPDDRPAEFIHWSLLSTPPAERHRRAECCEWPAVRARSPR